MAQSMFLLSVLTGAVLVALVVFLNARGWRQYTPAGLGFRERERSSLSAATENPTVWVVAFLAAILVFGGATVAFVSGGTSGISDSMVQTAGIVLAVGTAVVAVGYLFFGTFIAARGRGLGNAAAVALGSWALGLLFVVVVVVKLMGLI
ncbi:hypothetical protein [Salinigranum sp. GCM10025319]|uniref:hypothetical protein n=1 Tax=Salinigranum sp. GCM10025319 TaxID=3252687 RepID=UPI0036191ED2